MDTFMSHHWLSQEMQFNYYGFLAWGIISRISLPLMIFYRFHQSVILVEIWKNTVLLAPHPRWRSAAASGLSAQLRRLAAPEVARFLPAGRLGPDPPLSSDDPLVLGWLQVQSPPAVPSTGIKQVPFHRNLEHLMRL
ncbi:Proton channel OtopLc [Amphibalanus amphitrite]|uniref:Proton channel OtopLc n=1 Tax=Amphibalanus amphitrite TaxID=1232801 RepID=A0A6A4WNZ4_AMPAM|nr:Proton channel OtopLc [Amphibalanus amphitrite]